MEDNKINDDFENKAEEAVVNAEISEHIEEAAGETLAFWPRENDMGQFVQEAAVIKSDVRPQIRPIMWEDTPLFSYMGRSAGNEESALNTENRINTIPNSEAQKEEIHNNNNNKNPENRRPRVEEPRINNNNSENRRPRVEEPRFNNNNTERSRTKVEESLFNNNNPESRRLRVEERRFNNNNPEGLQEMLREEFYREIHKENKSKTCETRCGEAIKIQNFVPSGFTAPDIIVNEKSPLDQTYKFVNMPLPYEYNELEPYIDELTMYLHHDKHLQKYIDELNAALAPYPRFHNWRLERLLQTADTLPAQIRTAVINNGGGVYNHFFYFESLTPRSELKIMPPAVTALLASAFKSVADFKEEFKKKALSVFGSGYAWLVLNPGGRPEIVTTANQDTSLVKKQYPLLNIDVWEHAYYLKHHNLRNDYVDNWFNAVNWQEVGKRLSEIRNSR